MHKKTSFYGFVVASAICFVIAAAVSNSVLAASFQGLGFLPGGSFSEAKAASANGLVVVGLSETASGGEPFRWTSGGGMVGLGRLNVADLVECDATAVSANGSVVVGYDETTTHCDAFRWTSGGGMVGLGFLAGGASSTAYGVSSDGSVVVGFSDIGSGDYEAFRWTSGGGMVGLGHLTGGGSGSQAMAVSANGSVVVGYSDTTTASAEAFRWTSGGGMVGLGFLAGGSMWSTAWAVSSDGSVVVGTSDIGSNNYEAFRWTSGGGMVGLGHLAGGGSEGRAYGVSADGSLVVGYSDTASGNKAFIWDATNGMRDLQDVLVNDYGLDLTGWTLEVASGISADGLTVVGSGVNPSANWEAWVVSLGTPAPATNLWGLVIVAVGITLGAAIAMSHRSEKGRACTGTSEV